MSYAPLELTNKIAVVIGGTSGIGRAIARAMAEAGADVVPTSRRMDQVEATALEIEERGRRTLRVTSDVIDSQSLQSLLNEKGIGARAA
jgi:NADP-dependent 3-hydroxy acid dehydrogenase YdfG